VKQCESLLLRDEEDNGWSPLILSKVGFQIHSPYLSLDAFNPMAHNNNWCPEM
jgi:hypothetical protein